MSEWPWNRCPDTRGISVRISLESLSGCAWNGCPSQRGIRTRRNQRPISLIMFDIDCFKQYNDHYGHVRGDDCLRRVAIALGSAATRPRDFFARYGGEEFVLVLPETDAQAALVIAERCRALLFKEQIEHAASSAGQIVTLSMGITTAMPRHGADSRGFVEQADRQLYLAKQRGRNCIVADAG
ncbi:MAG: GGDEF domain-containing protein [Halopseudomonas yangmingensis]